MEPANLLFILADEHRRDALRCYGHPLAHTPNLDGLAARGVRFTRAYTNSPICVAARAALATGRYVHQTGHWDNAFPYHGEFPSWGHRVRAQGCRVDSIGKLHFRSREDDNGFSSEHQPLNVAEGIGEIIECLREKAPPRDGPEGVRQAGPGDSSYLRYDAENTDAACRWLAAHARDEKPWVLFLSLVCPHPPFKAPEEFFRLYDPARVVMPPQWRRREWPDHPALAHFRYRFMWDEGLEEEEIRRATITYYALCSYVDHNVGTVLQALDARGLGDKTRVIYTSDHGAMLGARGQFNKLTMYEQAAAVPFIMAGPEVPQGRVVGTPISLVDCFPTVLEAVGSEPASEDACLPGESLWETARRADRDRTVFSEYHAAGSRNAVFMLVDRRHKYVHYTHEPPQVFDLETDPDELQDLSRSPSHLNLVRELEGRLRGLLDPEATDLRCKADQEAKVEAFGGMEAVIRRGLSNSPVPGEKPVFYHHRE